MTGVPRVSAEVLDEVAPPWVCTDVEYVRKVKQTMMQAMMGVWPDSERARNHNRKYGTLAALALIRARFPPSLVEQHIMWKEGQTYEEVSRRRFNLLVALYPEW